MNEKLSAIDEKIKAERERLKRTQQQLERLIQRKNSILAQEFETVMSDLDVQSAAELLELLQITKSENNTIPEKEGTDENE